MRKLDRHIPWILGAVGVALLLAVVAQVIFSLPPRQITFLTGREGGAYYLGGQLFQDFAARNGFTVELVETAGSVEALQMLEAGEGDVALVQGGISIDADPENVSALATVAYEPLWILYRRELAEDAPLDSLTQLKDMRVSIGEIGSGTNQLVRSLLSDFALTDEDMTLLEWPSSDSVEGLRNGDLDAAIFVVNTSSPIFQEAVFDPNLELMSVREAEALVRRHRFLSVLTLPRGTIDLVNETPRVDVTLLATEANLIVRSDLHPDILRLLAFAVVDVTGSGSFFAERGYFPNTLNTDLPVSKEGETYLQRIKNNEFMLDRYLPFWASAMFDRYLLFVLPLMLILLPLLGRSPVLYQVYMRGKVNRWYNEVHRIERQVDAMAVSETRAAIDELEHIDDVLRQELLVSNAYMPNLYALRTHIDYVIRRLRMRQAGARFEEG
jgi:TRAP transporter TAXI family solute receptor